MDLNKINPDDVIANLLKTIARLERKIEDAELALKVWDDGRESEYWLRHGDEQKSDEPA